MAQAWLSYSVFRWRSTQANKAKAIEKLVRVWLFRLVFSRCSGQRKKQNFGRKNFLDRRALYSEGPFRGGFIDWFAARWIGEKSSDFVGRDSSLAAVEEKDTLETG